MPNIPPRAGQPITDLATSDPPTQGRSGGLANSLVDPSWTMEVMIVPPLNPERASAVCVSRKNDFYSEYNAAYAYGIAELDRIRHDQGEPGGEVVPAVLINDGEGRLGVLAACSGNVSYADLLNQLRVIQAEYMPSNADYQTVRNQDPILPV